MTLGLGVELAEDVIGWNVTQVGKMFKSIIKD